MSVGVTCSENIVSHGDQGGQIRDVPVSGTCRNIVTLSVDRKNSGTPSCDSKYTSESENDNSEKDNELEIKCTPHYQVVKKQKYASELLKKRINLQDIPVDQVFLPEETSWRIHDTLSDDVNLTQSELSKYR